MLLNVDDGLVDIPLFFSWEDFTGLAARKACQFYVVRDNSSGGGGESLHVMVDVFRE